MTVFDRNFGIDMRDPDEYLAALEVLKFEKLRKQIAYVFTNEDYYRQRFAEAGVTAPEDIRSLDDFRSLRRSSTNSGTGNRRSSRSNATAIPLACI